MPLGFGGIYNYELNITPATFPGLVAWWRLDRGITLSTLAITASGTSPPTVTITGTPSITNTSWLASATSIEIDITTAGNPGQFQWKLNGVVQQTGQTTSTSFTLGSTGLTADFSSSGSYSTNNVYTTQVTVSNILDQSGNGNHLIQNTVAENPYYTSSDSAFNNYPSASSQSAGSTTLLLKTSFASSLTAPWTIVNAVRLTATTTGNYGLMKDPTATWLIFTFPYGAQPGWNFESNGVLEGTSGSSNNTNTHALACISGTSGAIYLDNSQIANVSGSSGTNSLTGIYWGYGSTGSAPWSIVETAIYNSALTKAQLSVLFKYFAARYGIIAS
jgi:hypothetical protein